MGLAKRVFEDLTAMRETLIPSYDKSRFQGQGDRTDPSKWRKVNGAGQRKVDVVLFEGWCVGFTALTDEEVKEKYLASVEAHRKGSEVTTTLWQHSLEHLLFVNDKLRGYRIMTDQFKAMIHIDAVDTNYVYKWRLQQEVEMRAIKGTGMTEEQVTKFVDGYYPAYELYTDSLRKGIFSSSVTGCQLRLVVDEKRRVVERVVI